MATRSRDLFKPPAPRTAAVPTAVNVGKLNLTKAPLTPGIQSNAQALSAGLSNISTAFAKFGEDARARQLNNDIIRVKAAFALEKEMPGALLPEAQRSYLELTAKRDTRKFFDSLENEQAERAKLLLESDLTPTQQITQHEDFIRNSYALYTANAGFNQSQLAASNEIVEKEASRLQNEFIVAQSKKIASVRNTEMNQSIASIFTQTLKNNDNADDPLELSDLFTDVLHERVRDEIRDAFPTANDTDLDLRIIQVLGQIAADPDNPQPEILEYLDNPRTRKGRPRFTLIDKVGKAANSAITTAITTFNRVEAERKEQEKEEEKELHRIATKLAGKKLIEALQAGAITRTKEAYAQELRENTELQHLTEADIRYYSEQYQQGLVDRLKPLEPVKVRKLANEIKNGDYGTLQDLQADVSGMHLNDQNVLFAAWDEWERGELDEAERESRTFGTALKEQFKTDRKALARIAAVNKLTEFGRGDPRYRDSDDPDYNAIVKEHMNKILLTDPRFKDLETQAVDKEIEFNHKAEKLIQSIGGEDDPNRTRLALQALRDEILGRDKDLLQFQEAPKETADEVKEEKPEQPKAKGAGKTTSSSDISNKSNLPLPKAPTPYHITNIGTDAAKKIANGMEAIKATDTAIPIVSAAINIVSPQTVRNIGERIDATLSKANKINATFTTLPQDTFAKVVEKRGGINPALQINLGQFAREVRDLPANIVKDIRPRLEIVLSGEREFGTSRNAAKYLIGGESLLRKSFITEPTKLVITKMEKVFDQLTKNISRIPGKLSKVPGKLLDKDNTDLPIEPTFEPEADTFPTVRPNIAYVQEQKAKAIKIKTQLEDFGAKGLNKDVNLDKVNPKLPPISKYLFNDSTLISKLKALGATKFLDQQITSTGKEDRASQESVWDLSAHTADDNSVNAFDMRLHNITKRNRKGVARAFLDSLNRNGFETITAKSGKDFVTTSTQIWSKIKKGSDVFMVEVDTGNDHIHIQSGDNLDGTKDKQIIKQFN